MTAANIVRAMRLSAPSVHEMIGRLERGGLITRGTRQGDRVHRRGGEQAQEIVAAPSPHRALPDRRAGGSSSRVRGVRRERTSTRAMGRRWRSAVLPRWATGDDARPPDPRRGRVPASPSSPCSAARGGGRREGGRDLRLLRGPRPSGGWREASSGAGEDELVDRRGLRTALRDHAQRRRDGLQWMGRPLAAAACRAARAAGVGDAALRALGRRGRRERRRPGRASVALGRFIASSRPGCRTPHQTPAIIAPRWWRPRFGGLLRCG